MKLLFFHSFIQHDHAKKCWTLTLYFIDNPHLGWGQKTLSQYFLCIYFLINAIWIAFNISSPASVHCLPYIGSAFSLWLTPMKSHRRLLYTHASCHVLLLHLIFYFQRLLLRDMILYYLYSLLHTHASCHVLLLHLIFFSPPDGRFVALDGYSVLFLRSSAFL